jgi:hypothetical protein
VKAEQLVAQLPGVRVLDLLEDPQGVPPRLAGGGHVARLVVDVAEAAERAGLGEPVGELPAETERELIAGDGPLIAVQALVDEPEAVPGARFRALISELLELGECPLTVLDGLLVVTIDPNLTAGLVLERAASGAFQPEVSAARHGKASRGSMPGHGERKVQ